MRWLLFWVLLWPLPALAVEFSAEEKAMILSHGPWPVATQPDPSNRLSGTAAAIAFVVLTGCATGPYERLPELGTTPTRLEADADGPWSLGVRPELFSASIWMTMKPS